MTEEKRLHEEASQILKFINPEEILQISDDLMVIADCLETSKNDESKKIYKNINLDAAMILCAFAEVHGEKLLQIKKRHPNFLSKVMEFKQTQDEEFYE